MRAAFASLAVLPALALATIQITGPDSTHYWVQNTSNTITWTYTKGDPSPLSIMIVNSDVNVLNGAFSIDEYVDASAETYTVTDVTLKTGTGYTVEFVNPSNYSDLYAVGPSQFEVKAPGTSPAPTSPSGGSSSSSGAGSPSSSTKTSSSSEPSGTTSGTTNKNGAVPSSSNIFLSLATCGFVAVASYFA
jgi:hypothetical protein